MQRPLAIDLLRPVNDTGVFNIFAGMPSIKPRYGCLALIAHRRHLARLGRPRADRLVVSTDWIAWRRALQAGHDAIHFEYLLEEWPSEAGPPDDLFVVASRWMHVGTSDPTVFQGVSLGKQFTGFIVHLVRGHIRLRHGLERLVARFRPKIFEWIDLRTDADGVDPGTRHALLQEFAAEHGIALKDWRDPVLPADADLPEVPYQRVATPEPLLRRVARRAYAAAVDLVFTPRRRRPGGILPLLNPRTINNLVDAYSGGRVYPILIADQMPKSARFIGRCWRRGIVLSQLPDSALTGAERAELTRLRAELPRRWATSPGTPVTEACRAFFLRAWDAGEVDQKAVLIKRYRQLFARHRISRVVVGDAGNAICRLLMELAKQQHIPSDECLNGMFVTPTRHDSRCGDGVQGPLVSRLLSWGEPNERWLETIAAPVPAVRVGYPGLAASPRQPNRIAAIPRRVLVLPVALDVGDVTASRSNIMFHLIDVIANLLKVGIREIRVKTHPGRVNAAYYREALHEAGIDCPVSSEGGLESHFEWAEAVIGPPNSGAWVETLAMGIPYYPLLAHPSLIDPALCGSARLYSSGAEIAAEIAAGQTPDIERTLQALCSRTDIPDAAARFWDTMAAA